MLPQIADCPKDQEYVFMHDSAMNQAKSITAFLAQNQVPVLPGNSPDMNLIQNLWKLIKRTMAKEIITTKQLIKKLIQVWYHSLELREN